MKKIAIVLFVIIAGAQIASGFFSGFSAAKSVANLSAKHVAMMQQAENN